MIGGTLLQDDDGRDIGLVEAERRVRDRAPDAEVESHRLDGKMPDALLDRARGADLLVVGARRGRAIWSTLAGWMPLRVASRRAPRSPWCPTTGTPRPAGSSSVSTTTTHRGPRWSSPRGRPRSARTPLVLVHTWKMPVPQMEGSVALLASPIEARAVHRRILRDAAARAQAAHPGIRHRTDPGAEQSRLGAAARRARRISARARHAPSGAADGRVPRIDRPRRALAVPHPGLRRAGRRSDLTGGIRPVTRLASTGGVDAPGP